MVTSLSASSLCYLIYWSRNTYKVAYLHRNLESLITIYPKTFPVIKGKTWSLESLYFGSFSSEVNWSVVSNLKIYILFWKYSSIFENKSLGSTSNKTLWMDSKTKLGSWRFTSSTKAYLAGWSWISNWDFFFMSSQQTLAVANEWFPSPTANNIGILSPLFSYIFLYNSEIFWKTVSMAS